MKVVKISGGLGNQMFIYAFTIRLKAMGYRTFVWISKNEERAFSHQGYEIEKLFGLKNDISFLYMISAFVLMSVYRIGKRIPVRLSRLLYDILKMEISEAPSNFIYYPFFFDDMKKNKIYRGTCQSLAYFSGSEKLVKKSFAFNEKKLNDVTRDLAHRMRLQNSVSLHIRRGDYLSDQYKEGFGGICTIDYYKMAMSEIESRVGGCCYYVFSNDPGWVKENFTTSDSFICVEHNIGVDSWQDMYLMHCCKHNIIANSSFSWWGAFLNDNPSKVVIAPKLWWNGIKDDVVPDGWIRM